MLSSEPCTAQRMSSIASTVLGDGLERASVMVRLTAEKSLSDWAELDEMQRMRRATSANSGNSRPFSFQNSSGELCSAATRIALYLASSSRPDARLWLVGSSSFIGLPSLISAKGSPRAFSRSGGRLSSASSVTVRWCAHYNIRNTKVMDI